MKRLPWILILSLFLLNASCASYGPLQRENVKNPESIEGSFTLYIMQDEAGIQAAKAAIADREGDGVTLVPAVSNYDLKTYDGLSLSHAIETSRAAFATHCAYTGNMLRGLVDSSGNTVGYEIIPNYTPFMCDSSPSVYINYFDKGKGRIRAVLNIIGKARDDLPRKPKP